MGVFCFSNISKWALCKIEKGEEFLMVNPYEDNAPMEEKMYQEVRCLRSLLERFLRIMNGSEFVDYQMEKFGKDYKTKKDEK